MVSPRVLLFGEFLFDIALFLLFGLCLFAVEIGGGGDVAALFFLMVLREGWGAATDSVTGGEISGLSSCPVARWTIGAREVVPLEEGVEALMGFGVGTGAAGVSCVSPISPSSPKSSAGLRLSSLKMVASAISFSPSGLGSKAPSSGISGVATCFVVLGGKLTTERGYGSIPAFLSSIGFLLQRAH